MEKKWKKVVPVVLACCLLAAVFPIKSQAVLSSGVTDEVYCDTVDANLSDSEELYEGYLYQLFDTKKNNGEQGAFGKVTYMSTMATKHLTGDDLAFYNLMKAKITDIANGVKDNTRFEFDGGALNLTWTYSELGVSGYNDPNLGNVIQTKVSQKLNFSKIMDYLMSTCPYEMYWYDKATGYSWGLSYSADSSKAYASNLVLTMNVCDAYKGADKQHTNLSKTGSAKNVLNYANSIVSANASKSDYEKLLAYKEAICSLVEYNTSAASNPSTPYGDPWQLIYVFDQNPSTNVVCEGYSKAFQYLCEKTTFKSSQIMSYIVTGTMDGGGHMWNVVHMDDGKNYLVDVTNCDEGSVGTSERLFLKGVSSGNVANGYVMSWPGRTIVEGNTYYTYPDASVSYKYDANMIGNVYTNGELTLSSEDYAFGGIYYANIAPYRGSTYTAPVKNGCFFAGWYKDAACTTPIAETTKTGAAYAKFVSENVMQVKAQVPSATKSSTASAKVRLITTVDSLNYKCVGFKINMNSVKNGDFEIHNVYSSINVGSASKTPSIFCSQSKFFAVYTIENIPSSRYNDSIYVTPYWITKDGTRVDGYRFTKTVSGGISANS